MSEAADIEAPGASVEDIAELLGVTPRRVRQLADEGRLVGMGPRRFDPVHAAHAAAGRRFLGQRFADKRNAYVDAAAGWLLFHAGRAVTEHDLALWRALSARWGLTDDAALAAVMAAHLMLADAAPPLPPQPAGTPQGYSEPLSTQ